MTTPDDQLLRVLIVDDDAVDRERVARALRGMQPAPLVVEADDIVSAEIAIDRDSIDCIILDYRLPSGACLEFLPALQARAPRAAIVVLTGQGDEDIAVELMKAGATDYLSKDGVDPARLCRSVRYGVHLRRAQARAATAESRRHEYAERMRRFVDRAPEFLASRSLTVLAETVATIAVEVFEVAESAVVLREGEQSIAATFGQACGPPLLGWAIAALAEHETLTRDGTQIVVSLRGRDAVDRGVIALRGGSPVLEHLLRQLAAAVALACDNLALLEAASRAIRARDDVMAVVSHDLRTPLNNVRLGTSLLRDSTEGAARSVLERVDRNVGHMARLVDDLVDKAALEGGNLRVTQRPVLVRDLLTTAATLISNQAQESKIHLTVGEVDPSLVAEADRDRVLQVLSNLLANAIKFTPDGGHVETSASDTGSHVRFSVRDSGSGIPAHERDRVFLRFWQSDPKRRRGLGLGLYIARGLVHAHGGELWIDNNEDVGTRFYFTIPKSTEPVVDASPTARVSPPT